VFFHAFCLDVMAAPTAVIHVVPGWFVGLVGDAASAAESADVRFQARVSLADVVSGNVDASAKVAIGLSLVEVKMTAGTGDRVVRREIPVNCI
jgi:hypothetical protein